MFEPARKLCTVMLSKVQPTSSPWYLVYGRVIMVPVYSNKSTVYNPGPVWLLNQGFAT